jgi:uncharacterized membrane protein YgcG
MTARSISWLGALASVALIALLVFPALALAESPNAGPPYPEPTNDVVVYDYADILSPETEARATQIITGIEQHTGAEVVVYTQYKPGSTDSTTADDALALINQWGVGRKGYDDGLAIMWNTTRSQCLPDESGNGRIQLYAAPGYAAAYLSNSERQSIFDNDMVPLLTQCDEDGALLAALAKIDAAATPGHANMLATARIIDASVGLIGAPLILVLLVGWAGSSWLRYGKDPVYLDDPSILMPAPPTDLTAASAAVVWEGRTSRRALTTAMLDLASRGELSFKPEEGLLGIHTRQASRSRLRRPTTRMSSATGAARSPTRRRMRSIDCRASAMNPPASTSRPTTCSSSASTPRSSTTLSNATSRAGDGSASRQPRRSTAGQGAGPWQ